MADIELVIKIPEDYYEALRKTDLMISGQRSGKTLMSVIYGAVAKGTPLPKGHGRLVDIGKIDEDMVDDDNPIIYLTTNRQYIEAVSLDYLNDLPTIIEADEEEPE